MIESSLNEPLSVLKGEWKLSFYSRGNEIVREVYFSSDISVRVVLEKKGAVWSSEIYSTENKEDIFLTRLRGFGPDSYRKVYNLSSGFSVNVARGLGVEYVASE